MYDTILTFIKFNNFGTWHLDGPRHLCHSFCCTTRCIFEPMCVYDPGFNAGPGIRISGPGIGISGPGIGNLQQLQKLPNLATFGL